MAWLEERWLGFPIGPADAAAGAASCRSCRQRSSSISGAAATSATDPTPASAERAVGRRVRRRAARVGLGRRRHRRQGRRTPGWRRHGQHRRADPRRRRRTQPVDVVVGALAVVNANGSVVDPSTRPAVGADRARATADRPTSRARRPARDRPTAGPTATAPGSLNTTIGVVATSAALTKAEVGKFASVAHDGMARAIRPAHSMFDGDTIFGLATGARRAARTRETRLRVPGVAQRVRSTCCSPRRPRRSPPPAPTPCSAQPRSASLPSYFDLCPSARPHVNAR